MLIVLLFVVFSTVFLIFQIGKDFEWDMVFPIFLGILSFILLGTVVSSSIESSKVNEYKTRNIEVINDNIYYDGFQPIVYIYNNGKLEKFKPYKVVYSASAKKPVVIEVTSTNNGIIALGDYYKFKVLLIPKK